MPKIRHRKRVRTARLDASGAPLGSSASTAENGAVAVEGASTSHSNASAAVVGPVGGGKKVGKKEAEVSSLLEKLASEKVEERVWASSALSSLLLTLPEVTLRLLLSKNLIGLLIERLSDSDDEVVVECLGSLRNLAVSSPASILSEMHNKHLLKPLATIHLPLLLSLLPTVLAPPAAPLTAPLPSTPTQRLHAEIAQSNLEKRRRLYWDWSENVLMLIWCLAESNTKILGTLNNVGEGVVRFLMSYLAGEGLGIGSEGETDGMEVEEGKAKKGKKVKKVEEKKERVPLFVALAAAQALHALVSDNPVALGSLIANPALLTSLSHILATSIPPAHPTRTDTHHSTVESDAEDFATLRVVVFGILLEVSKTCEKGLKEGIREALRSEEGVLLGLLGSDLEGVAGASLEASKTIDPEATPGAKPSGAALNLASYEKKLSTLQLSLEILGGWCATLDSESLSGGSSGANDESEEEWGGIPTESNDVEMEDGSDEMDEDDEDKDESPEEIEARLGGGGVGAIELSSSALKLLTELPLLLLKLATPTSLSFPPPPSTASAPAFIPTSATPTTLAANEPLSPLLSTISESLTTIHVRSIECLNNIYITLARASAELNKRNRSDLQRAWEGVLELIQTRLGEQRAVSKEQEEDRGMELVMAGVGAVWGMARCGLGEDGQLIVGPSTTPFLIEIFKHPFATAPTPAGEAIQVRIVGALGWVGQREDITPKENEAIGTFLASILPSGKTISPLSPTPEVLLQSIDSLIDLYSDEDSTYDVPVFRSLGFLPRLESAVTGVRMAVKKIDRKKFPELRSRAEGALENLVAFVEYRKGISA